MITANSSDSPGRTTPGNNDHDTGFRKLTDRVWTAHAGSYRTLVVEADSSVIVVNSFGVPSVTKAFRQQIDQTFPGKSVSTLIQTIDHLDHTGASESLGVSGEIIGHQLTAALVERRRAPGQLPITRPIVGKGETITLDGVRMNLIYAGPTVGTGNLAVEVPEESVLFVVGPQANARYGILPDFHFKHVTAIWRQLAERHDTIIVPGRYDYFGADILNRSADYLDAIAESCQRAFAQGVPIWEVDTMGDFVRSELQDEFGHLDGFIDHVSAGAIRIVHYYLMGGWGMEDTVHPDRMLS